MWKYTFLDPPFVVSCQQLKRFFCVLNNNIRDLSASGIYSKEITKMVKDKVNARERLVLFKIKAIESNLCSVWYNYNCILKFVKIYKKKSLNENGNSEKELNFKTVLNWPVRFGTHNLIWKPQLRALCH